MSKKDFDQNFKRTKTYFLANDYGETFGKNLSKERAEDALEYLLKEDPKNKTNWEIMSEDHITPRA